jgi:hypothetical protein
MNAMGPLRIFPPQTPQSPRLAHSSTFSTLIDLKSMGRRWSTMYGTTRDPTRGRSASLLTGSASPPGA